MDLRKRRKHSVEKLPLGTTRWVKRKRASGRRYRVKEIKVAHTYLGRPSGKWVNYSRYLFEKHKGPVPKGKRVIHRDGDLTNFALDNLVLGTAADVLWVHCHVDPVKSAANQAARAAGAADHNRERAAIRRRMEPLPTRWYAVDLARKRIVNDPCRVLARAMGAPVNLNGSGYVGWRLGWPELGAIDSCLLAAFIRCPGPRRLLAMLPHVNRVRAELLIAPAEVGPTALRSAAVRLGRAGLIERTGRGAYRATGKATADRGPVCPFVFLKGSGLADERYRDFALVEPEFSKEAPCVASA